MTVLHSPNMVIYRRPYHNEIELFKPGDGLSKFVIAPFLKSANRIEINGNIETIRRTDLQALCSDIQLPQTQDSLSTTIDHYTSLIEQAQDEIGQRRMEKVVLAGKQWLNGSFSLHQIYLKLLDQNPGAFVYLLNWDGLVMIGASPELLLEKEGVELRTVALGGTETHGVYTEKEYLEHQQIRDYIEEKLKNRIYQFTPLETSSVPASKVSHLKTPYCMVSKGLGIDLELVSDLHPTSAVCGLPYDESIKFIKENEGFDRKFYAGYLGPIQVNSDFRLYVNLRCASIYQEGAMLFAGAGINAMSSPIDEWQEINNKMQTIAQCLK